MNIATHPAVDAATEQAAIVVQNRPVVPLSSWLTDAMAVCGSTDRSLQVLSPVGARITLPLRTVLQNPKARWVIEEPDGSGHFDGFSGMPLVWDRRAGFVAADEDRLKSGPSATFLQPDDEPGSQLWIDLRLRHDPTAELVLGAGAEVLAEIFGEADPAGWGTSEPALAQWNPSELTALCRRRAPQATWTVFTGPGNAPRTFAGTHRAASLVEGVKETITFAVGYPAGTEPALDRLRDTAAEFAKRGVLKSMTVQRLAGRADLTYSPLWSGMPVPVGVAIGAEAVAEIGTARAEDAPAPGERVGPARAPGMWYPLGPGTDPGAWSEFSGLMSHLHPEGGRAPG
ncbi:hypothetical protein GCM10027570_03190 [Streptomonospora sediminis]